MKKLAMHGFKSFPKKTEILFDKGINVILGPNGAGKSCSYDTVVTLANGEEVELGRLVEEQIAKSKELNYLDDGVYVNGNEVEIISLNKNSMKSEKKLVSKFIKREGDVLFNIKTRSGRELKATGCHPVMTFSNGEVNSKKINEMDKGFFIAVPRVLDLDLNEEDEDFARLMGYIIGDGYIAKDRIEFINKDSEVLQDYESLVLMYSKWGIRKRGDGKAIRIYTRDRGFVRRIKSMYGDNILDSITSERKTIPNEILMLGKKSASNLLAGIFDTDGSVRKDVGVVEFCSKNMKLARQVQSLLLRFGINSKIKRRFSRATNTRDRKERPYYYLYIYGADNMKKFYDEIPIRIGYKRRALEEYISKDVRTNENVDLLPREVNKNVKEVIQLLGLKIKRLRKEYPSLAAYAEDRCSPSRSGIKNIIPLLNQKFGVLFERYNALSLRQNELVEFMDMMCISSRVVSEEIGLHGTIIRNQWASGKFKARESNLEKFMERLEKIFLMRVGRISKILNMLTNICESDIFWDEIVSIEKLDKPDYVYDLTVEENHNFIANNIFTHNSNISDALCFVLGRLSVKSMRAAKASNLIFMGSKFAKPAKEASVEMVFDNSDRTFNLDKDEISLRRIVRRSGQSIYKINEETKTRAEIIEILAHAGIDPYGFNIVLQGGIDSIIKMHPEERRKIIEEVAGISIYESRKERALKELEKTDLRLKDISTILRERTAYLKNLESERAQAQKYKELELTARRAKASILHRRKEDKMKEVESIVKSIEQKNNEKEKNRSVSNKISSELEEINSRINQINKHIQEASGVEQSNLSNDISNLRAELEGLRVRKENYENRRMEIERRIEELESGIPEMKKEINELKKKEPGLTKKNEALRQKKEELALIEDERKRLMGIRSELEGLRERVKEKREQIGKLKAEGEGIVALLEKDSSGLRYKNERECSSELRRLRELMKEKKEELENYGKKELESEKIIVLADSDIKRYSETKKHVGEIEICPLCKSKMSDEHKKHVFKDSDDGILNAENKRESVMTILDRIRKTKDELVGEIFDIESLVGQGEIELVKHRNIIEKKERLKRVVDSENETRAEIEKLEGRRKSAEEKIGDLGKIEERRENKMLEIEDLSARTDENLDATLLYKEQELEKVGNIIKRSKEDLGDIDANIEELSEGLEEKESLLEEKEEQEEKLNERFRKMLAERDSLQKKIQERSLSLNEVHNEIRGIEEQINYLKIGKAKLDAEAESIGMELSDYVGVELLKGSLQVLQERLGKASEALSKIGSINMRALEVYDSIKEEYDRIFEKVQTLEKEKGEVLKIIEEIDKKKSRTFIKTFNAINDLFSLNFSKLYTKGTAYLEIENKEDIFAGGVDIVVKLAKGKYFDLTSLSGGEKTLVALALLFAIQEHKPYHFYIFDEIDAALDKRNSERLAALFNQYMKAGQYIVITHNDAIIMNSNLLYGVSMQDGASKVLSMKVN